MIRHLPASSWRLFSHPRLLYALVLLCALVAPTADASLANTSSIDGSSRLSPPSTLAAFPASITPSSGLILVLGSDGLIGAAVTDWLHTRHYRTLLIHNRSHVDLRSDQALPAHLASLHIQPADIAYAFFLACEVGGSKFLQSASSATQSSILTHNLAIYQAVLPFLAVHSIPFLFTSSYLSHMNTPYGAIKRTGEQLVRYQSDQPLGRIVRLWNIYGRERVGGKSHVLTDWVVGCATEGAVRSMSDGWEWRQFLHANDTAAAMGGMMEHWQQLPLITDLSSTQWVQMRHVAQLVAQGMPGAEDGGKCATSFSERAEGSGGEEVRERQSPDTSSWWWQRSGWRPAVSMQAGIADLYGYYGAQLREAQVAELAQPCDEAELAQVGGWSSVLVSMDGCSGNDSRALLYPTSSAPPFLVRPADGTVSDSA